MSRAFKILFIILGLGVFILPKQTIYAQSSTVCCDQKSTKEDCCKTEKTTSCHSEDSKNKSDKNNCGDHCKQCHSCTVHFVLNYISPESQTIVKHHSFSQKLSFDYENSYFSSNFQNIWQPPKIG
jgi:hypothetical protein